jgi:hypothetical protein
MEMLAWIVVLGLGGGGVVALLILAAHRLRPGGRPFDAAAQGNEAGRTDVINIASIRVSGVGGLGMIAMAATLAWAIPRIGQTIVLGAVLGVGLAAVLILWRRRVGPIPTSGGRLGANTTLSIDQPADGHDAGAVEPRNSKTGKVRLSAVEARR